MKHALQKKVLTYLENHHVMSLATVGKEGVWSTAVYYVNTHFTLYFLSASSTRHGQNMAANPTLAATIQEDYDSWQAIKGIQLEGTVAQINEVEKTAVIAQYSLKFPIIQPSSTPHTQIAQALSKASWYKITPHRLYFIDNSLKLGHRDQVPLD